jgi:hypothetical protein
MLAMNHVRKTWLAAALALAVAAPGTTQAAGWTPAVEPLGDASASGIPALAANGAGDLAVAAGGAVATRSGGGALTATVLPGAGGDLQAAINANGDVAVAWATADSVHYAVRSDGGKFGAVRDLASTSESIDFVRVGLDDAGDVALAWVAPSSHRAMLRYAVFAPGGGTIASGASDAEKAADPYFDLAADGDGNVVVAYSENASGTSTPTVAVRAAGASTFSAAPLGASFANMMPRLDAALDDMGHAAVAFESYAGGMIEVHVAYAAPGGAFGPELTASMPGQSRLRPMIALGRGGDVVVTWTDPYTMRAEARAGTFNQPLAAPITTFATGSGRPSPAVAPDGRAVVTWAAFSGGAVGVFSAVRPPGEAFAEQAPLSARPSAIALDRPGTPVAMDAAGHAFVAWVDGSLRLATDDPAGLQVTKAAPPSAPASDPPPADAGTGRGAIRDGAATALALRATPPVRCRVPALTGLSYVSAKARLRSAHCAIGRARKPKGRRTTAGLVIRAQSRRAGTLTKAGAKVDVTLRARKPARHR